jgi:hypothetical protein
MAVGDILVFWFYFFDWYFTSKRKGRLFYWGQFAVILLLPEEKEAVIAKCWGKYDLKILPTTLKRSHFRTTQMAL